MGKFTYDGALVVDFDDRVLAHLQIVITSKLRRGESFAFAWRDDASIGDGRTTVWVNPNVSLIYKFLGGRQPVINRAWLEALSASANSSTGLHVVQEPI
jgi:hypothetical protein